jgi:hypothetical protein
MKLVRRLSAIGCFAVLSACTATGEAQRPALVVAAVGKVVESLAAEATQRQASDAFRGLPVVVRNAGANGAETVVAELLRTRLVERGLPLEVACPAKCLEITLLEFVMEATGQAAPGQLLPVNAGAIAGLTGLPRAPGHRDYLAPGHASALLATFAARDGNRYSGRQQVVAVVAIARSPESAR